MSNLVFPALPGLIFPVVKTPMWSTTVQEATSGTEVSFTSWSFPLWKYELGYELLRDNAKAELWGLMGFFNQHYGRFDTWLFDDPDDNTTTDQSFGTGDGVTTAFQLVRTQGGFVEPVKATHSAPAIKKAGVLQTLTTHYTVSATGLVTFVTAPANGAALTWSGTFYWRCRFLEDAIDFNKFAKQMWEAGKIPFRSTK